MKTETRTGLPIEIINDRVTVRRTGAVSPSSRLESPERHREPPDKNRDAVAPYRSKLEARFAARLEAVKTFHGITDWWYQPCTLRLANGARYRPDFLAITVGPRHRALCFYEVKGWHPNRRDSLTHLKWAASLHKWADFWLVQWKDGRWQERQIR